MPSLESQRPVSLISALLSGIVNIFRPKGDPGLGAGAIVHLTIAVSISACLPCLACHRRRLVELRGFNGPKMLLLRQAFTTPSPSQGMRKIRRRLSPRVIRNGALMSQVIRISQASLIKINQLLKRKNNLIVRRASLSITVPCMTRIPRLTAGQALRLYLGVR
jgi:hypothetical protein